MAAALVEGWSQYLSVNLAYILAVLAGANVAIFVWYWYVMKHCSLHCIILRRVCCVIICNCTHNVALASAQGVDTVPTSTLRTSAFLAQHPCHSLETYTKLRYALTQSYYTVIGV